MEKSGRNRLVVELGMQNQKGVDLIKELWNKLKKMTEKERGKGKGVRGWT
jgi:hypothetical protein